MAVYKVPQDVEADDKLLGPFSFRQFIYLIIVAVAGMLAFFLFRLFPPLVILPFPVILFFGALALPLKKDQPMETYLAAIVSFYLKPRKRIWDPDGIQSLVEIVAPRTMEVQRTKDLSQDEAERRLSYLAQIADTQGWAVRGVAAPMQNTAMNDDLYFEAQQVTDVLDDQTGVGRAFDTRLAQADAQRKQDMMNRMHQQPAPQPVVQPQIQQPIAPNHYTTLAPTQPQADNTAAHVSFNPYPNSIHQSVITPLSEQSSQAPQTLATPPQTTTSEKQVSPDIISLASNPDLSIETIAHEAKRIQKKEAELGDEEVIISLH